MPALVCPCCGKADKLERSSSRELILYCRRCSATFYEKAAARAAANKQKKKGKP